MIYNQYGGFGGSILEETMKYISIFLIAAATLFAGSIQAATAKGEYQANFVPYMVTQASMCPEPDLVTHNKDIKGFNTLLNRQMLELSSGASSRVPEITAADRGRIDSYIAEIEAYQLQVNTSTPADYPGTHRLFYCLLKIEDSPLVTSQAINDLLTLWTLTNGELLVSASSQLPATLREPDNTRLSGHIQAMKNYLAYVDASAVQDYPRQHTVTERIKDSAGQ